MKAYEMSMKAEMLSLTYGTVVAEISRENDFDVPRINEKLEEFGFKIGARLIDEFLAKSQIDACQSFEDIGRTIAEKGLDMFLGVSGRANMKKGDSDQPGFVITFVDNPLDQYVSLPENLKGLQYSKVICGVIRGALEAINMKVSADFTKDKLRGDDCYEIRVTFEKTIEQKIINYDD